VFEVAHETFCKPRVELELAFVLGKDSRRPGVGLDKVMNAQKDCGKKFFQKKTCNIKLLHERILTHIQIRICRN
jgi:hypothetical protein